MNDLTREENIVSKKNKKLTPFERVSDKNTSFAINMYTFYLFQKSCTELLRVENFLKESIKLVDTEDELERLMKEYDKNDAAWDMIMQVEILSGSSCYAEA